MVSQERTPTIGLDIENSLLKGNKVNIWDLSGQERFRHMWKDFLRGSGLTVVVLDSTEENVSKTKEIVDRFSNYLGSKIIAIANKQDLPDTLSAHDVQRKLGIRTYGMSAIVPELRERLKSILEYEVLSE
jgi:small GTP-binding protein